MSDKKAENGNGSFWTTVPGCLTGIAAIITAIGGLIAVLFTVGILQPPSSPPSAMPTQIPITNTMVPSLPICVPSLISPQSGNILDNGRTDSLDSEVWDFDWSDCPGASEYHLYVISSQAPNPVIDNSVISSSSYQRVEVGYIGGQNRYNWTWKVRARVNGQWGEWSETRVFDVEPENTDPPAP